MTQEYWKPVPGYEGKYEASTLGRVKSLSRRVNSVSGGRTIRERILKPVWDRDYYIVGLGRGNENRWHLHALIALTFLGPRPDGCVVRHGTAGPSVNSLDNLSYGTYRDNEADKLRDGTAMLGEKHHASVFTDSQVREIRQRYKRGNGKALAVEFGVHQSCISAIITRKTWAHLD